MHSTTKRADGRRVICFALFALTAAGASAQTRIPAQPDAEGPVGEHADQATIYNLVVAGESQDAFDMAFEFGDELFEAHFNSYDGVGANVGLNQRFTRVPRMSAVDRGSRGQSVL